MKTSQRNNRTIWARISSCAIALLLALGTAAPSFALANEEEDSNSTEAQSTAEPTGDTRDKADTPQQTEEEEAAASQNAASGPLIAIIDTGCDPSLCEAAVSVLNDDPSDSSGHGTSVAHMVLGQNEKARILSIKALDADGQGSTESICAALRIAIDSGADIVNMSFSSYAPNGNPAIEALVQEALANGIAVVAAAGNEGADASQYCPAQIEGVITIGALDENGDPLTSSNSGSAVNAWIDAASTSYAAAIASGRLSITGKGTGWLESLIAYGDIDLIETIPVEAEPTTESGEFSTAFTHATLQCKVHVSNIGDSWWMTINQNSPYYQDNKMSATSFTIYTGGHYQHIENVAFKIIQNSAAAGGIVYRVYYQNVEYDSWRSNGAYSPSSTGRGLCVEGIEAKLTGTIAYCYDLTYSVYTSMADENTKELTKTSGYHVWHQASNGGYAGTTGQGLGIDCLRMWLTPKSYTHVVQVRYQNPDGTYGNWSNARSESHAYGSTVPAWSRSADATYNAASMAAYTAGYTTTTKQVSVTRKSYRLDVTAQLDGANVDECGDFGTFDFNVNGANQADDAISYSENALAGSSWSISDVKTKPGYSYDGIVEGAASGTLGTANQQAARLAFHTNTYTIAYDGNGATNSAAATQEMKCHQASVLAPCMYVRDGYEFTGWNTEPDGSGLAYEDGQEVSDLALEDGATVTLYAQWRPCTYLPKTGSGGMGNTAIAAFACFAAALYASWRIKKAPQKRGAQ